MAQNLVHNLSPNAYAKHFNQFIGLLGFCQSLHRSTSAIQYCIEEHKSELLVFIYCNLQLNEFNYRRGTLKLLISVNISMKHHAG